jgi:cytochrome c553
MAVMVSLLPFVRPILSPPVFAQGAAATPPALDYETFKTKVQPILTAAREGNARCAACHARGAGSYLEPLPPGSTTYTEDQSRRNFDRVSRLVVPGEPLKSILLLNPLDTEAGGTPWHEGGKHWHSQDNPEWQTLAAWVRTRPAPPAAPATPATPASRLSYDTFKTKVQPILTAAREGNARCAACHARGAGAYLEPLPPGSTMYTEDQSRRNFDRVSRLVVPGEPLKSILLLNPLDTEAGGTPWHEGGKHWHSQDNTEWQTLAAWVRGS